MQPASDARAQIQALVQAALGRAAGSAVPAPPPPLPPGDRLPEPAARVERFRQRLQAVGGRSELVGAAGLTAGIVAALRNAGARCVLVSDAPLLRPLAPALERAEIRCLLPDAPRAELLAADAGVTTAQLGIAETGTLVLDAGSERARVASLLPPLHIALLPQDRLVTTLGEALAALPRPLSHAVTFVTGPSRTADIELQLVVGVHGPRDLLVLLT